ncbi:MAG TPA: hypothetical protein VF960_08360, partial [Chloroflexota bacterium]
AGRTPSAISHQLSVISPLRVSPSRPRPVSHSPRLTVPASPVSLLPSPLSFVPLPVRWHNICFPAPVPEGMAPYRWVEFVTADDLPVTSGKE